MPDKANWEDTWANAFEEGFYDNVDGAEDEKKALLLEKDAQGRTRVVGVAHGEEAQRVIAEAQASGVEVHQNAAQVQRLLEEEIGTSTDVPPEIYDLMSTMMGFAQELSLEWSARGAEALPRPGRLVTELEFSHEDIG
jgi:type III secretion system FlhB-like substrate exporter